METLIAFLKRLHPISASLEAELRSALHFVTVKKNTFLLAEGDVCQYAWYLQKGLVRCFYSRHDDEVTTWFMPEDNIIVLIESLFRQRKSLYNIQALEDCELYRIRFEDVQHIVETHPEAQQIRTIITDLYGKLKDIRSRAVSKLPPDERYAYFVKHFPQLPARLTLDHIASYLNISRSSVVRARRKNF